MALFNETHAAGVAHELCNRQIVMFATKKSVLPQGWQRTRDDAGGEAQPLRSPCRAYPSIRAFHTR